MGIKGEAGAGLLLQFSPAATRVGGAGISSSAGLVLPGRFLHSDSSSP